MKTILTALRKFKKLKVNFPDGKLTLVLLATEKTLSEAVASNVNFGSVVRFVVVILYVRSISQKFCV